MYGTGLCVSTAFSQPDMRSSIDLRARKMTNVSYKGNYSKVSFCDGSFYDDSLLRPLSNRTEHSRLVVHHCHNSIVLSLLNALLALFRCACVSSFSILVQFFKVYCDFSTQDVHQKDRKEEKIKTGDVTFFLDVF